MTIWREFDTPNLDQAKMLIFGKTTRSQYVYKHIIPWTCRRCIEKPILYLDDHNRIKEISIFTAFGLMDGESFGLMFSIFGKDGQWSERINKGTIYSNLAIASPNDSYVIDDVTVSDDDIMIANEDLVQIISSVNKICDVQTLNEVKMKFNWETHTGENCMIGTYK